MKINLFYMALALGVSAMLVASTNAQSAGKFTKIAPKPVPVVDGKVELNPKTTMIEFVGIHVGDDPKPRVGGFKKFAGTVELNDSKDMVKSMNLEIDVDSLWTEFDKLTGHLKNKDFFETAKFGKASFASTKVEKGEKGLNVTGDLMLHGVKKEVTFPMMVKSSSDGVMMKSEFNLDRTLFGMDKMTSGVEKTVSLQMIVGQKTAPRKAMGGPGGSAKSDSKKGSKTETVSISAPNMD